ncbi:MAG: LLM class flavin-dependent oxidoreductase [Acidimicrobiales bacterium]|nr:LLM class flavin-dependent oxidoreductase [Acidimicrobiales bacterium]
MRFDCTFFGTVPMSDAGNLGPRPFERRYGASDFASCYENLVHWAGTADRLGFDTMWFTEHHFQHEGYEVVPNQILLGLYCATQTRRLRFGQMFNIVPQWHPLRLAEDFAMADVLSGGRLELGVGRGTVPREAQSLGAVVASGDNAMSEELDRLNREHFEEAMEVILASFSNERFSFTGKHFVLPPVGIPDRGSTVSTLTLVPKPMHEVTIYQAATTAATIDYVARKGFVGVFTGKPIQRLRADWERFGEAAAESGRVLRPGEGRALVVNMHLGQTHEEAMRTGRDGHDEYCRFLAPYGRFRNYAPPPGLRETPFDYQPSLEESIRQQVWAVGSPDEVAETLLAYREALSVEHLCCFFDLPGLTREELDRQLTLFAEQVVPLLGMEMGR